MGLTLIGVLISIGSLFFFGLPVARLLSARSDVSEFEFVLAPFIGLGVIVLTLQNLVYLDLRVGVTMPWLWGAVFLLWIWLTRTGRLASLFSHIPRSLLVVSAGVYLIQGLGLLIAGAQYYVGRAYLDQFTYTVTAQFLTDFPFGFSYADIGNRPYLFKAISLKDDRIGASVLHAFFATSTLTDAKTTFEPTILLAPLLIALAVYLLGRQFSLPKSQRLLASAIAGVLPGITTLHLESFLAQAVGIPLLLVWPVVLSTALAHPTWKQILRAALILAAGTSVYPEFFLIFLGAGAVLLGTSVLAKRQQAILYGFRYVFVVGVALLLNVAFVPRLVTFYLQRGSVSIDILNRFYPWALSSEGLERLWLGYAVQAIPPALRQISALVSVCLLLVAYFGLVTVTTQKNRVALAVLALAALPWLVFILGRQYAYQFYKLLLTVSPLLPLGIALTVNKLRQACPNLRFRSVIRAGLIALFAVCLAGTSAMTLLSGFGLGILANTLMSPATRQAQTLLAEMNAQNVYIAWYDDVFDGAYVNGWLSYFARRNRVWLDNPRIGDVNLADVPKGDQVLRTGNVPEDYLLLIPSKWARALFTSSGKELWEIAPYSMWQITGGDWAVIADISNASQNAQEQNLFWATAEDTSIAVHAGKSGILTLSAECVPSPNSIEPSAGYLEIRTDTGFAQAIELKGAPSLPRQISISLPIAAGRTKIALRAWDSGNSRRLSVGISELRILDFKTQSVQPTSISFPAIANATNWDALVAD